jgi:hypothetical protein
MAVKQPYCAHCHHPAHRADCGVDDYGCVKYEPRDVAAREARKRPWLVDVQFFFKNRWIAAETQRVKAAGHGGAAMAGIRAAKKEVVQPRQRVEQVKVTLTPVKGSTKRGE